MHTFVPLCMYSKQITVDRNWSGGWYSYTRHCIGLVFYYLFIFFFSLYQTNAQSEARQRLGLEALVSEANVPPVKWTPLFELASGDPRSRRPRVQCDNSSVVTIRSVIPLIGVVSPRFVCPLTDEFSGFFLSSFFFSSFFIPLPFLFPFAGSFYVRPWRESWSWGRAMERGMG